MDLLSERCAELASPSYKAGTGYAGVAYAVLSRQLSAPPADDGSGPVFSHSIVCERFNLSWLTYIGVPLAAPVFRDSLLVCSVVALFSDMCFASIGFEPLRHE